VVTRYAAVSSVAVTDETLRPQEPMDERAQIDSVEWLFEPDWPGPRCIARCGPDGVSITDATGAPIDDPALTDALVRVLLTTSATLGGVLTERGSVDADGRARAAFVATDLLELDSAALLDVPFQERRRLLESVVAEDTAVRIGPIVKQPVARWFPGWREAGFTHYLARHQNARSHPGQRSDDWLRIPLDGPVAAPGLVQRLIGSRSGRVKRIHD
jgi:bifunctional non-homologous end joining protein LigD